MPRWGWVPSCISTPGRTWSLPTCTGRGPRERRKWRWAKRRMEVIWAGRALGSRAQGRVGRGEGRRHPDGTGIIRGLAVNKHPIRGQKPACRGRGEWAWPSDHQWSGSPRRAPQVGQSCMALGSSAGPGPPPRGRALAHPGSVDSGPQGPSSSSAFSPNPSNWDLHVALRLRLSFQASLC